jgi:hypothetical protein
MTEASGTGGFLRLSQEYEAAFGRDALHSLIQEMVPDEDYVPDHIHIHLMRLPWRDVFTTNWDTLLERTGPFVADRAYSVVRTSEEIPSALKPRIVKLHGSFPAHVPFIFTEEDYRTYPKRFATFVNTVQQAMMETVLCLIGFSGDDPNFLHWSGWVRDNLGESAPKIYLAGWLDLSPHRRRMLEARNVVPIDLARHPQGHKWPEHLRHQYATEWLLHSLERGQPYDVTQWPSPSDHRHSEVPERLQPVEDVTVDAPQQELRSHVGDAEPGNLLKQVRAIVDIWKHNRRIYPGWLVIPPSKYRHIQNPTDNWEKAILRATSEFSPIERLFAFQELVWRRENLLEPLSESLDEAVQSILHEIDCTARTIGGKEDRSARWADIREAWRNLAMALLTTARQRFDRNAFDDRRTVLAPFFNDHPDVAHRVYHERCLWALYDLDFAALDELLDAWRPEGCDPAWMTRKAAILVETNRSDEAIRLLNRSLSIIRETPLTGRTLAGPSREGWTLWLALAFEHQFIRLSSEALKAPPAFARWQQLAALECDAYAQKRDLLHILRGDPENKDGPLFDLGALRRRTVKFSSAEYERWVAARQAVRLCEVVGLPPSAGHIVIASDILNLAADHLLSTDWALATRLALRLTESEDNPIFNRIWSRPRIAAMPIEEVTALRDIVANNITYVLPRVTCAGTDPEFWVTRLRVAMEALSRLVLRLPPEQAEEIFQRGLSYYRMEGVAKHHWLHKSVGSLMARAWEALPQYGRARLFFDVMGAPIAGIHGFSATIQSFSDPGTLLVNDGQACIPLRAPETEARWIEIVDLIVRGLRAGSEARKRAASRLATLAQWDRLTDPEKELITEALWSSDHTGPDTLPSNTGLYDWVFLLLPQPEPGLAEQRLRGNWFRSKELNEKRFNKFFWDVGTALAGLAHRQRPLTLTTEECANFAAVVEEWIKIPLSSDDNPFVQFGIREAVTGLQFILPEIELSHPTAEALFAKVLDLNQTSTPGFQLLAGLAKVLPDRLDDIAMSLRMGLASDDPLVAENGVMGLHAWLITASQAASTIPLPPCDLLREIGMMIASRRKGVLNRALQVARWIFSDGSPKQRDAIAKLTLDGLRYLIEELRYDRNQNEDAEVDVPLLRWGCAHLALAMSASGYETDQAVICWAQAVQDDPLPEVRHAQRPALASLHAGTESAGIGEVIPDSMP